jgi:DNA-binding CsgD family transcriptional regulator
MSRLRAEILGMQDRAVLKAEATALRENRMRLMLLEGIPTSDIAERMGMSLTATKSLKRKLKKTLLNAQ